MLTVWAPFLAVFVLFRVDEADLGTHTPPPVLLLYALAEVVVIASSAYSLALVRQFSVSAAPLSRQVGVRVCAGVNLVSLLYFSLVIGIWLLGW